MSAFAERRLRKIAALAERAARRAGERAAAWFGRLGRGQVTFKGRRDLVTEADLESERIVREELRAAQPDWPVFGEEELTRGRGDEGASPELRGLVEESEACWIVDPLDGTTNFAHEHPFFAVSVAFVAGGRPRAGVVFAPVLGECFVAWEGGGAHLGPRRLRVDGTSDLGDAVFASGFPYRRDRLDPLENNIEHVNRFLPIVRGFRRGGSAALDLCYVAAGRFSFFFEKQLEPWDVAAGALLVREAGGRVTDHRGGDDWLFGRSIVASNGAIHDTVLERLR